MCPGQLAVHLEKQINKVQCYECCEIEAWNKAWEYRVAGQMPGYPRSFPGKAADDLHKLSGCKNRRHHDTHWPSVPPCVYPWISLNLEFKLYLLSFKATTITWKSIAVSSSPQTEKNICGFNSYVRILANLSQNQEKKQNTGKQKDNSSIRPAKDSHIEWWKPEQVLSVITLCLEMVFPVWPFYLQF